MNAANLPVQLTCVMRDFANGHWTTPWSGTPTLPNMGSGLAIRSYGIRPNHMLTIPFGAFSGDSVYKLVKELAGGATRFTVSFSTGQGGQGDILGTYDDRATGADQPFARDVDMKTQPGHLYFLNIWPTNPEDQAVAHEVAIGVAHYGGTAHWWQ